MKISLIKRDGKLEPAYKHDTEWVQQMKPNTVYMADIRRPRNPKHHNLIHALAKCTLANMPESRAYWRHYTPHEFIKALQLEIGITEKAIRLDGTVYQVAKSLSFESMNEDEFQPISDAMFEVCAKVLGCTVDELKTNYENYL